MLEDMMSASDVEELDLDDIEDEELNIEEPDIHETEEVAPTIKPSKAASKTDQNRTSLIGRLPGKT